jgi:hypothetical protein
MLFGIALVLLMTAACEKSADPIVLAADGTVTVSPASATIKPGETVQFTATSTVEGDTFIWNTDAKGVALIDSNGIVTGVAEGTVAISAFGLKSYGTGTANVKVLEPDPVVEGETVEGQVEGETEGQVEGQVEGEIEGQVEGEAVEGETPALTVVFVNKASTAATPDGLSWATAYPTLQIALDMAVERAHEVWVAKGVYDEKRSTFPNGDANPNGCLEMQSGVDVYGGFAGTETERTQRNWTANQTVIDGSQAVHNPEQRPAYGPAKGVVVGADNTILDGFVIRGGAAGADGGGGMFNPSGTTVIAHCIFRDNSGDKGGAMLNTGNASPIVTNCLFYDNSASTGGSAIHSQGSARPIVVNCTISQNTGGTTAVYGGEDSLGMFYNCIVFGNEGEEMPTLATVWRDSDGDPQFVDSAANDFRLQSASPCINAGMNASAAESGSVTDDFAGTARPQGEKYDIGAYEYTPPTL